MRWKARQFEWDLTHRCLIMGILNVTPDSFSDGGRYLDEDRAVEHAADMISQGADILDIGGESTRPGAAPVDAEEECRRVLPAIEAIASKFPKVAISIDTSKASVAEAAMRAGAHIINDVMGLEDSAMAGVAAASQAGLVLMHMKGKPRTMQASPSYEDVLSEIRSFLERQAALAMDAGVAGECLAFDPGIGFGKALEHNLQILKDLSVFQIGGQPVLLGVSRKSFIGKLLDDSELQRREWPTVALTSYAVEAGVRIVRVHDVRRNSQAARMTTAIGMTTSGESY